MPPSSLANWRAYVTVVLRAACFGTLSFGSLSHALSQETNGTQILPIPNEVWDAMAGVSWHDRIAECSGLGCSCPKRNDLSLLLVPFWDFDGQSVLGKIIVHRDVGREVADIFDELYRIKFHIARMELIEAFGGDDNASMAANNTSGFNCRVKTGGKTLSKHSSGRAIDINPVQNPFVKDNTILPPAGRQFDTQAERNASITGLISKDGPVVNAFKKHGWKWGGDWSGLKDFQHFSDDGT